MSHDVDAVKKAYLNALLLWFSLAMAVVLYGGIAFFLFGKQSRPVAYQDANGLLRSILFIVSLAGLFSARILSQSIFIRRRENERSAEVGPRTLLVMALFEGALCESSAVLGLILAVITSNFYEIIPFFLIALTGMVFYFPQKAHWGKWLGIDF